MINKNNKIQEAISLASSAHSLQKRKPGLLPYLIHPFEVAGLVASVTFDHEIISSAFLHDVVEDTIVSIKDVQEIFGDRVAGIVDDLTDISKPSDGNRKTRRKIDLIHTSKASPEAQTIKLADIISNTRDISSIDPDFAKIYMNEKRDTLTVLNKGEVKLFDIANNIINDYFKEKL